MERTEVNALLDTDLPEFLEQYGLLDAFNAQKLICYSCGRPMTSGNLYAIFKRAGRVLFCCNTAACMNSIELGQVR